MDTENELKYEGEEFDVLDVPGEEVETAFTGEQDLIEVPDPEDGEKPAEVPEEHKPRKKDPQKRINELTRKMREAEERAFAAETRAAELEAERSRMTSESLTQREQDLIARRKEAVEDGEMEQIIELGDELMNLRLERANARQPVIPVRQAPEQNSIHPAAEAWLSRNEWFDDENHASVAQEAQRIEKELLDGGMKYSEKLYEVIDTMLVKTPVYKAAFSEPGAAKPRAEKPNHIAPASRSGEPPAREKPGQLTQNDIQTMRTWGFDMNNPKHRAAYLKRKGGRA